MGSGLCTWTSALRSSKKFTLGAVSGDPLGWSPTALRKAIPLERGPPSVSRVDVEGPHAVPVADMGVRCRLPHPADNQTVVMVWPVHAEVHIPPHRLAVSFDAP
jgi:hypothetical protein